jgi:glycine cleavage system H protein
MNVPSDLRYTKEHEWVRREGTRLVVGVTDFAQSSMGDIVHIEHPSVGVDARAGDPLAEIESTKSVSEIYAPTSGRVVEVNAAINDAPELVNSDPYGAGWIFVIEAAESDAFDSLLSAEEYAVAVEAASE